MGQRGFLLFFLWCGLSLVGNAQQLELTRDGLRSSADPSSKQVEYASKELAGAEMFDRCSQRLAGVDFLAYNVEREANNKRIVINGYIDGAGLLVFGRTEILFKLYLDFEDSGVKTAVDLTKSNGSELSFNAVISKKGKVLLSAPKKTIETTINTLIENAIGDIAVIRR